MNLAVLGQKARDAGTIAARHPTAPEIIPVDPDDPLDGDEWHGAIVDGETENALRLARSALAKGLPALLLGSVSDEEEIPGTGLTLSRPLRFDPHLAGAKDVVLGGTVGVPRTLELCWSFDGDGVMSVATHLVDAACFLLDSAPALIYAIASEVMGPPLVKINLLTANGSIAVIEAAGESGELPTRRDLHLIATNGEIVHRIGKDDLLWTEGRAWPLTAAPDLDELRAQEIGVWLDGERDRLARGAAVGWNLAASRALARSLATGETVRVGEEVG